MKEWKIYLHLEGEVDRETCIETITATMECKTESGKTRNLGVLGKYRFPFISNNWRKFHGLPLLRKD